MKRATLVVAAVLSFSNGSALADPGYSIVDLGTLGGTESAANGLNDFGDVVGRSTIGNGDARAFIYRNGTMTDLGVLGAYASGAPSYSAAQQINNSGQVVGVSSSGYGQRAFIYSSGSMTDLGTLNGGQSAAYDINDSGIAVGSSRTYSYYMGPMTTHATSFSGGSVTDLGTYVYQQSDAGSHAYGINNGGQIVGAVSDGNYQSAFLYQNGTMINLESMLGLYNRVNSVALDINDNGQIAGYYYPTNSYMPQSFIAQNGSVTFIGTLGGSYTRVAGINDHGWVVGVSRTANGADRAVAFIDGALHDLNSLIDSNLGWDLVEATDINNNGQIVGYGRIGGFQHAFLMTPLAPIPEPETYALLLAGLALLSRISRKMDQKRSIDSVGDTANPL